MGIVTGRDLSVSAKHITIGGTQYTLKFNNNSARIAEDVYAEQFKKDIGYYEILEQATKLKHAALMALYYGAMVAGGTDMPWADFDDQFTLTSIEGMDAIIQAVLDGAVSSLPTPTEDGPDKAGKN